jgi:hypothetical protein
MKATIETIKIAIVYLETIPAEEWIAGSQSTREGNRNCVIGHLALRENSPFYDATNIIHQDPSWGTPRVAGGGHIAYDINNLATNLLGFPLHMINNNSWGRYPQETEKERVLAALHEMEQKMEAALAPAIGQ